jgi:hypothetical protein
MAHASRRIWRRDLGIATALGIAGIAAAAPAASVEELAASAPPLTAASASASAPELAVSAQPARQPLALQVSLAALRSRLQSAHAVTAAGSSNVMLDRGLNIQVVELPREGASIGPPPKRAHHAISVGMEGPKQMLRGLGLDATECAARFRLPSKLSKKADGSSQIDVMAQLGMGCKF